MSCFPGTLGHCGKSGEMRTRCGDRVAAGNCPRPASLRRIILTSNMTNSKGFFTFAAEQKQIFDSAPVIRRNLHDRVLLPGHDCSALAISGRVRSHRSSQPYKRATYASWLDQSCAKSSSSGSGRPWKFHSPQSLLNIQYPGFLMQHKLPPYPS